MLYKEYYYKSKSKKERIRLRARLSRARKIQAEESARNKAKMERKLAEKV
jgi:hypothetical protein